MFILFPCNSSLRIWYESRIFTVVHIAIYLAYYSLQVTLKNLRGIRCATRFEARLLPQDHSKLSDPTLFEKRRHIR